VSCAIALDVGGTFTDVALVDGSGRLTVTKTPSTPADPAQGFLAGVAKALALAAAAPGDLEQVLHGTTIATNAILEGKGAATGLLTTAGFRYVLEIGRHDIPRHANMFAWQKPPRPVPPELIFEIPERLAAGGDQLSPVDESAVAAAARRLREAGVASVAVCFLHSYANPAHERRAREILLAEHPGCAVSLSSEVLPVFREYERSMATALNAYVLPIVGGYVGRLEGALATAGVRAPLRVMKSNGGVIGADVARHQPIHTALSGPAAGAVGARLVGAAAGFADLISVDVGGTSADVCLIRDGEAEVTSEGRIGDWPLHLPMLDVHTIGAGGGSIARVAEDGTLMVGPQSAGAAPGPVCYGAGGEEPTVTDAHLVLGRIPPRLGGGEIRLDVGAARRAVLERIARPLGLSLEAAASGILDIVNHHMVGAIRLVSVERGHDPRAFALVPFGGAGPLHGGALADLLEMRTIVVPPNPGVLSALGLLASDVRNDYARTSFHKLPACDRAAVAAIYADLEARAGAWLDAEGVPARERRLQRLADLRYRHQGFEIPVPWSEPDLSIDGLVRRFHERHRRLYTYALEDAPVEIVTVRVAAAGRLRRTISAGVSNGRPSPGARGAAVGPGLPATAIGATAAAGVPATSRGTPARIGARQAYFAEAGGWVECAIHARESLATGATLDGPAIVEQVDSTTVVLPGQRARADRAGNLIIQRSGGEHRRTAPAPPARGRRGPATRRGLA
jgi:N-methylhydantoinase A